MKINMKHKKKKFNYIWLVLFVVIIFIALLFIGTKKPKENVRIIELENGTIEDKLTIDLSNESVILIVPDSNDKEISKQEEELPPENPKEALVPVEEEIKQVEESTDNQDLELYVINGDFEDKAMGLNNFDDYDNNVAVGYTYMRNSLSPINGVADVKIKVTRAKKDALNRPAFSVDLSKPVSIGNSYVLTFKLRSIKGDSGLYGAGFGKEILSDFATEEINDKITAYTFNLVADTNSSMIYIYFNGTKINEFRIDDIELN